MNGQLHSLRKARIIALSVTLWRRRLVFWFGAILVGVASSYFAILADMAQDAFNMIVRHGRALPLLVTPLVFALSVWATRRWFPAARGSGIPQAIAARIERDPESRRYLLSIHIIFGKIVMTLLALLGGASIGREGPTVQIGASILLLCATFGGLSAQRGVVLAGAAAGVAAAFNTPLAGIVFAIEEMARAFEHRNSTIVLIAIVLSGAASMSILGNYDYFGYANAPLSLTRDGMAILAVGAAGGIVGGLFVRLITDGEALFRKLFNNAGNRRPIAFAAVCGLIVALLGLATHGVTYGSGYQMGYATLHGEMAATWWQMPAKLLATVASAVSGIPGGIFSPSLAVGASLGNQMAGWFSSTPLQGIVLLAMVSYFAGVTQAPITAFVIVLEITGKGTAAVPLMAAAVIGAGLGRLISPVSLYHRLARGFIAEIKTLRESGKIVRN